MIDVRPALLLLQTLDPAKLQALASAHPEEAGLRPSPYLAGRTAEAAPPEDFLSRKVSYEVCLEALEVIRTRCSTALRAIAKRMDQSRRWRLAASVFTLLGESTLLAVILGTDNKNLQAAIAAVTLLAALATLFASYVEGGSDNAALRTDLATYSAKADSLLRSLRILQPELPDAATEPILEDLHKQTTELSERVLPLAERVVPLSAHAG